MSHRRLRRIHVPLLMLACAIPFVTAPAGEPYAEQIAGFREFVAAQMERDGIPGLSVGFLKDDFTWADGFGYADLENKVPAKPESAYRLASVTKPMTAIGVLQLVEQGKIDLDADVQTYVPYFPKKEWPVTVRRLLGHLGGISHYQNYDLEGHFKEHKDTREAIAVFEDFDLVAEPGTRYSYSSYGYNLLGAVIEGASGQSYGDFMRENLWGPLGMDATRMDDPVAIIPNRVRGYQPGPGGTVINSEFVDISSRFAAGGTRSTVIDLLKFARGLNEGKLLSPETMTLMLTPMATRDGRYTGYGMGWGIRPVNARFTAAHSGGQAETRTYFIWFPDQKLAIAIACNFEGADRMPYVRRLYEEVMDEPWSPPVYAGARELQLIHAAMRTAWESGLSRVEHTGQPLSSDPDTLKAAFAFFNSAVSLAALEDDFEAGRKRIGEGSNPVGDDAIQVVGSYMAAQLVQHRDAATIERLHRDEAIPFFAEYVGLYRGGGVKIPKPHRLDKPLEKLIARWNEDWSRTWNEDTWHLDFGGPAEVDAVLARMQEAFSGASVYPDHWNTMETMIESLAQSGRIGEALKLAEAGRQLYSQSGPPHFYTGLLRLAMGQRGEAVGLIRQAGQLEPDAVGSGYLNNWAYTLRSAGFLDLGLGLLQIAVELHPDVANLYDSLGEFLLEKGDREAAIRSYEKALEVDPEFENAQRVLAELATQN